MSTEFLSKVQVVRDKIAHAQSKAEERVRDYEAMREELSGHGEWPLGYYSGAAEAYSHTICMIDTLLEPTLSESLESNEINTTTLIWNVIHYDINRRKIEQWNVFTHGGFYNDLMDLLNKGIKYEEFCEELDKILKYYFWSKCEHEIVINSWPTGDVQSKIDIYGQLKMNFDVFAQYIWNQLVKEE